MRFKFSDDFSFFFVLDSASWIRELIRPETNDEEDFSAKN
jgi:hypothetical protein